MWLQYFSRTSAMLNTLWDRWQVKHVYPITWKKKWMNYLNVSLLNFRSYTNKCTIGHNLHPSALSPNLTTQLIQILPLLCAWHPLCTLTGNEEPLMSLNFWTRYLLNWPLTRHQFILSTWSSPWSPITSPFKQTPSGADPLSKQPSS